MFESITNIKTEKRQCFARFQFVVSIIDLLPFFKGGEKKIDTQSSSYGECVWTIEANQRKFAAAAFIQSARGLFDPSSVSYWTKNALDWIIALQMNFLFLSWLIIILSKDLHNLKSTMLQKLSKCEVKVWLCRNLII